MVLEPANALQLRCAEAQQRNPRRAEELDRAMAQIDQVRGMHDEDRVAAFDRAADAITDGIRIFISYKSEDQTLGILFKEMLADYGARRLHEEASGNPEIFLAAQSIFGGDDWRKEIKACIKRAHWFILLLPDVEIDRDLLVWEAGYFDRGMCHEAGERLICVHHRNAAQASQLQHYQGYTSDAEGIENLFTDLFFTPNAITGMQPVAPPLKLGNLKRDVLELFQAFRAPQQRIEPIYCLKHVDIAHREGATYETVEELLGAQVLHGHELHGIFNRGDSFRGTLGELIGDIHDEAHGEAWVGDLARVLNDVVTGRPPRRTMVPFFGYELSGQFRACLHCVRRASAGGPIASFRIIFVEEFRSEKSGEEARRVEVTPLFGTVDPKFKSPKVFVLMPFSEKMKPIFSDHIKTVAEKVNISCGRADDFFSVREVVRDIWHAIFNCRIVIADCTGRNPNVFYEIGIAHTIGRPTIIISQNIDDIPFDLRHLRSIVYDYTPRGIKLFEHTLENTLKVLMSEFTHK